MSTKRGQPQPQPRRSARGEGAHVDSRTGAYQWPRPTDRLPRHRDDDNEIRDWVERWVPQRVFGARPSWAFIRGVASRSGGRHDYVPGRMPTWWTQVLAVGLASRRASSIGWRHTSQTPYFPATKRSIAASTSRKWSRD